MATTDAGTMLSAEQIKQFDDEGFLLLRGVLDPASLEPVIGAFKRAVDKQANEWFEQGQIDDKCESMPFETRYGGLRQQLPPSHSNSWRRILVCPETYALWQHPALVSVARGLVGDELYACKTWNGRPRAPKQDVQTIGWHQDAHYYRNYAPEDGRIISVWMPLVPVDETSGCLQVAPGSHKGGMRPSIRLPNNGLIGLADEELEPYEPYSCVMNVGDVLVFSEYMFHRALPNNSDRVRWSIDIRYHNANDHVTIEKAGTNSGRGYYCFSAEDPMRVEPYETWEAGFDYEGEF